jgi:hypothetical protein
MYYLKLPTHKQLREIRWQTIDAAATATVASVVVGLFVKNAAFGLAIFCLTMAAVVLYLLIELRLEQVHAISSHHTHRHDPLLHDSRTNVLLWGAIIGALAIGNFWLYFERHGVTYSAIPATAPIYKEAVILAGLTVAACLLARTIHHRFHFSRKLELRGRRLVRHFKAYVLAFAYTFALLYFAVLLTPYGANISFALLVAALFVGLREFQRFDRKHHRKHLVSLHKQVQALKNEFTN